MKDIKHLSQKNKNKPKQTLNSGAKLIHKLIRLASIQLPLPTTLPHNKIQSLLAILAIPACTQTAQRNPAESQAFLKL